MEMRDDQIGSGSEVTLLSQSRKTQGPQGVARIARYCLAALALLSSTSVAVGCANEDRCTPLDNCASDLILPGATETTWYAVETCKNQVFMPPQNLSLLNQPAQVAGERPPEVSTSDWCQGLVFNNDKIPTTPEELETSIKSLRLWFDPPMNVYQSRITYEPGNQYNFQVSYLGMQRADFSASCLTGQGVALSCRDLSTALQAFLAAEPNLGIRPQEGSKQGSGMTKKHVYCVPGELEGCTCEYPFLLVTSSTGLYSQSGSLVNHFDSQQAPVAQNDVCVQGYAGGEAWGDDGTPRTQMDVTGHHRSWLFNQAGQGFRNMSAVPSTAINCTDGVRGVGELGIDCGPYCESTCCWDGVQSESEEGIDCGGPSCQDCTCFNGEQDTLEDDIDCGGPCVPCACKNGVMDGDEEGVDCGAAACRPCGL